MEMNWSRFVERPDGPNQPTHTHTFVQIEVTDLYSEIGRTDLLSSRIDTTCHVDDVARTNDHLHFTKENEKRQAAAAAATSTGRLCDVRVVVAMPCCLHINVALDYFWLEIYSKKLMYMTCCVVIFSSFFSFAFSSSSWHFVFGRETNDVKRCTSGTSSNGVENGSVAKRWPKWPKKINSDAFSVWRHQIRKSFVRVWWWTHTHTHAQLTRIHRIHHGALANEMKQLFQ